MSKYLAIDLDPQGLFVVSGSARGGAAAVEHALAWVAGDEHGPPPLTAATAKAIGEGLRDRLKAAGIPAAPVLVGIGRDKVILKDVKFPPVPPAEEPALVRFQALKELTESPDEVILDYLPLADAGADGERRATVVAVRKDVFAAVQAMCAAAGLRLAGVTPRPFAVAAGLARAVAGGTAHRPGPDEAVAALTLGTQGGEFTVVRGGEVAFTRSIPAPVLANEALLVGEVRRNLTVYAGVTPIRAIYLAEAEDLLGGWAGRLRAGLAVPVHAFDPVAGAAEAVPDKLRGRFAGAAGLLAGKAADALPVNFVSPRQPRAEANPLRRQLALAAVVATLVLGAGAVFGYLELEKADAKLAALQDEKADLEKKFAGQEADRKRLEAVDQWAGREVNYLDELYDMADRLDRVQPAGNRLRVAEFKGTPQPIDKAGKQDGQAKLDVTVGAKDPDGVSAVVTAVNRDSPVKGKYYSNTQMFGQATTGAAAASGFGQVFTLTTRVYHRPPADFVRAAVFVPPPRPKTAASPPE